jgi:hypothetical protein
MHLSLILLVGLQTQQGFFFGGPMLSFACSDFSN